jgi:hypothetical protein
MCFSSTISEESKWGSNQNIPTSHQFVGQFRELAALRGSEAHHF